MSEARFDIIGLDSLHGSRSSLHAPEPYEVRVRITGRTDTLAEAARIGNEVETLYTNGPAGGGGVSRHAREIVAVQSVLVPRDLVRSSVQTVEA